MFKFIPYSIRTFLRRMVKPNHFMLLVKKPKGVMLDIGAESGYEAILFAKAGWNVISFEPDPNAASKFRKNVKSEGVDIELRTEAVSSKTGNTLFNINKTGNSSLSGHSNTKIEVNCIRLDDFCTERQIQPDFIKIDVEGNNFDVLRSYDFSYHKPRLFSVEYDSKDFDKMLPMMCHHGYSYEFAIYKNHKFLRLSKLKPQAGEWGDIIFELLV